MAATGNEVVLLRQLKDLYDSLVANTNTTYGPATQSSSGLMSVYDKKKLDGLSDVKVEPSSVYINGKSCTINNSDVHLLKTTYTPALGGSGYSTFKLGGHMTITLASDLTKGDLNISFDYISTGCDSFDHNYAVLLTSSLRTAAVLVPKPSSEKNTGTLHTVSYTLDLGLLLQSGDPALIYF